MKNQLPLISLISIIVFFTGIMFKIMHWPGASILTVSGAALGVVFLLLLASSGLEGLKAGTEKISIIIGVIAILLVLIGFAFKTQHWPGGGVILILSHIGLFISSIVMFFDAYTETDNSKKSIKLMYSFTVFILMTILLFLAFVTEAIVLPA